MEILEHLVFRQRKILQLVKEVSITTNNRIIYEKIKLYRNHGVDKIRYYHLLPGSNFRLTNILSLNRMFAIKRIKLIKKRREEIFFLYQDLFSKK